MADFGFCVLGVDVVRPNEPHGIAYLKLDDERPLKRSHLEATRFANRFLASWRVRELYAAGEMPAPHVYVFSVGLGGAMAVAALEKREDQ